MIAWGSIGCVGLVRLDHWDAYTPKDFGPLLTFQRVFRFLRRRFLWEELGPSSFPGLSLL